MIGASDPTLKDIAETPMSRSDLTSGAEINANAIATALDDFPLQSTPLGLRPLPDRADGGDRAAGELPPLADPRTRSRPARRRPLPRLRPARLQLGADRARPLSDDRPRPLAGRLAARLLRPRGLHPPAGARHVRPLRPGVGRRPGLGSHRRRPAPRGPAHGRHGPVQRHPRLHDLLRDPRPGAGPGGAQRVPRGDDLSGHGPRRHPDLLHGRRDHGRLRRPDRDERPRRSGASPPPRRCSRSGCRG